MKSSWGGNPASTAPGSPSRANCSITIGFEQDKTTELLESTAPGDWQTISAGEGLKG